MKQGLKRILFTGSQGTGKSTLVTKLTGCVELMDFDPLTNQQRVLLPEEKKLLMTPEDPNYGYVQCKIVNHHMNNYFTRDQYISDRCILDQIAYTKFAMESAPTNEFLKDLMLYMISFTSHVLKQDVDEGRSIIFYTPIEFDTVSNNNELRPDDKVLREKIDTYIRVVLEKKLRGRYITLTGDVESRFEKIKETLEI